jgi:MFS family permease
MRKFLASLNAFTFSGVQVLLIALFPFLSERLELSLPVVIGSFGLGSALFLVGSPFWSQQSDATGRAPVLAAGAFGLLVSLFILWGLLRFYPGAEFALPLLVLSRVVYGLLASAIAPVAQSLQADSSANPAGAMHLHSWSLNLGRASSLVVFIALGADPESLFAAYLLWVSAVLALNIWAAFSVKNARTATAGAFKFGELKSIFAVALLFGCFVETLNSSLGGFLKSRFDLQGIEASSLTARLLLACALGVVLTQTITRALRVIRLSPDWLMTAGTAALVLGGFFLASAEATGDLNIAVALLAIGIGLLPPVYLAQISGPAYGKRAGLIGFAHAAGYALGMGLAALRFQLKVIPLEALLTLIALAMLVFFYSRRVTVREAA